MAVMAPPVVDDAAASADSTWSRGGKRRARSIGKRAHVTGVSEPQNCVNSACRYSAMNIAKRATVASILGDG